jgi:hypothetical protein
MISKSPDLTTGLIVSQNLEFEPTLNTCSTDAVAAGPFLVLAPKYGWITDPKLRIECEVFHDLSNVRLLQFLNS